MIGVGTYQPAPPDLTPMGFDELVENLVYAACWKVQERVNAEPAGEMPEDVLAPYLWARDRLRSRYGAERLADLRALAVARRISMALVIDRERRLLDLLSRPLWSMDEHG